MTSPESCPHLQEELEAVRPLSGGRAHTVARIWMIYSKTPICSILTAGGICYIAIFVPYTEQTPSGMGKGYGITSVLCLHSRISSERHGLAYKGSNQLVLAASEVG